MKRFTATLVLLWALVLGPALCAGGLMEHACDCGHESDVECEHEDSCPDDPCATAVRTEEQDALAEFEFSAPRIAVAILALEAAENPSCWSGSAGPPLRPDRWNLPFALSDRPQRI